MNAIYSVRLHNASGQPWTFCVFQEPAQPDARIASLAWIASPCAIADGAHATLMWGDGMSFVWCTHASAGHALPFTAGGQRRVLRSAEYGVLFNLDHNAPNFEPGRDGLTPGPLSITVAANVPNNAYAIGSAMDGAGALITTALMAQRYDFTPRFWIGAGHGIEAGKVLPQAAIGPRLPLQFPGNDRALAYTLNLQNQWRPSSSPDGGDVQALGPVPAPAPQAGFSRLALKAPLHP